MLARHEAHVFYAQRRDDLAKALHALAPQLGIVGGVRQVAGEDDEIGLLGKPVHRRHGLLQRVLGVGICSATVAPVRVGELHEMEVGAGLGRRALAGEQASREGDARHSGKLEEIAAILLQHGYGLPQLN